MNPEKRFLEASEKIGQNLLLIQGAGGNTSQKIDGILTVKASGKLLSNALQEAIFVDVDLNRALSAIQELKEFPGKDDYDKRNGLRPSIETTLHALLPHTFVFHVHCVKTIAWTICAGYQKEIADRLFGLTWASVPYRKPGIELTKEIAGIIKNNNPNVLVLENHGLVVGASSVDEIERLIELVGQKLDQPVRESYQPNLNVLKEWSANSVYTPATDERVHQLALSDAAIRIASGGSLYPDHVVFLGPSVGVATNEKEIHFLTARVKELSIKPIILVPGAGVLVPEKLNSLTNDMIIALALVVARIPDHAAVKYLSVEQENELMNWEAEHYRQSLQKKS